MGKLKTKKTLIKRIKITGTGKLLRNKISKSHLKVKVDTSSKHSKRREIVINATYTKKLKTMLPKVS